MRFAACLLLVFTAACATVRPEHTFVKVCWFQGKAFYPPSGMGDAEVCEKPEPIKWDHTPIRVWPIDHKSSVHYAVNAWNEVRKGLFVIVDGPPYDVMITSDPPRAPNVLAVTFHRVVDGRLVSYIEVWRPGPYFETHIILVHELGHVLGLGHDDYERSIMYGRVSWKGRISDADRKAIRKTYPRR